MKTYGWRIGANEIAEIGKTPVAARVVDKKRERQANAKRLREIMDDISEDLAKNAKEGKP